MEDDAQGQRVQLGFQNLKLRPPKFTGKTGENIRHFLSKFEKFQNHQQMEENHKIEALFLCLEGDALEFAGCLDIEEEGEEGYQNLRIN